MVHVDYTLRQLHVPYGTSLSLSSFPSESTVHYLLALKADSQYDATTFMQLFICKIYCHSYVLTAVLVSYYESAFIVCHQCHVWVAL